MIARILSFAAAQAKHDAALPPSNDRQMYAIDTYGAEAEAEVVDALLVEQGACNAIDARAEARLGLALRDLHAAKSAARPDPARIRAAREAIAQWGDDLIEQVIADSIQAIHARAERIATERAREAMDA